MANPEPPAWPDTDVDEDESWENDPLDDDITEEDTDDDEDEPQTYRLVLEPPAIPVTVLAPDETRQTVGFQLVIALDGAPSGWGDIKATMLLQHELAPVLRRVPSDLNSGLIRLHGTTTADGRLLIFTFAVTAERAAAVAVSEAFAAVGLPLTGMKRTETYLNPTPLLPPPADTDIGSDSPLPPRLFYALRHLLGYDQEPPPWWDPAVTAAIFAPYLRAAAEQVVAGDSSFASPSGPLLWTPGQSLGGRQN